MQYILAVLYGLVFGIANIIPGVSGGTMLVVFGCYDKVCGALTLNFKEIKKNIVFLVFFGIGAVGGIVGFSFVVTWLFESFPTETYMFFMGLIVGSIPLIIRNATVKKKFSPACLVPFLLSLALVVGLAMLEGSGVSDPTRISSTRSDSGYTVTVENNSDREVTDWYIRLGKGGFDLSDSGYTHSDNVKLMRYEEYKNPGAKLSGTSLDCIVPTADISHIAPHSSVTFTYEYAPASFTPDDFKLTVKTVTGFADMGLYLIAGFTAAVAMIIPGVSGSFVMVLFGTYASVIGAIKSLDFAILIPTAIGVLGGLVLGARLITFLLKKHRLMVFSAILGLVAGSLYAIFPPGFGLNSDTFIGAAVLILGFFVSYTVGKHTKIEED
ncbi:MAG: DUF368 domain-containing protein [Ruminiclostridium sp.]|nr:DUF368 domain-containing protein [Ruminiclostridium sp.]